MERAVSLTCTFGAHCRPASRAACAASAGRAGGSCLFFYFQPLPAIPYSRIGNDPVALPHVVHEAGPEHLAPASSRCRLPFSSPSGILTNGYDVIVPLRLPCGDAVGDTSNRVVAPSLVAHHASHLRNIRGCWIVETLKASGVTLPNLPPQVLVDRFTHAFWYLPS